MLVASLTGCAPAVPAVGDRTPSTSDAGSAPVAEGGAPRPDTALPARIDAAAPPRDVGGEARADTTDGRLDSEARDGATAEVRVEAGADQRVGRTPVVGDLAITELLVDPTGNDLGHEWIEIANLSDEALDLSELRVADDAAEVAVDAGGLAPRARLVLGQSADRDHNGDAPVDRAYGTRLALNNGADRVTLCAGPCAAGRVLASFAWAAAFGAEYAGRAVIVSAAGATCAASDPYGSAGDRGTPGRPDPPCPSRTDGGTDRGER